MNLVKHPDPFLKSPTEEVTLPTSDENKIIIQNMITLMYLENGIGLAANQAGYNKRIFVMDVSNERNHAQVFINPVITSKNNKKVNHMEGCLSCPNQFADVKRPIYVGLKWICRHGKEQYKTFYHLPARVVQH